MKKKIITFLLINLSIIVTAVSIDKQQLNDNFPATTLSKVIPDTNNVEAAVTPYHTPTADPIILLIIWLSSGYNLQPTNQYTYVNAPKTLYTDSGRSLLEGLLGLLDSPHYTWYQSTDEGKTWSTMSSTSKYLTVTPNKVGTVYYQQKVQWYTLVPSLLDTIIYSQVASITTSAEPVNATKLEVEADSTYLYNNQSQTMTTFVRGLPTPVNATGDIVWSVNDTSLATVDSQTGLVTANNSGKSGTVKVTGTITNNDGTTVKGTIDLKIGGGLDDETIDEGQTATFDIQGSFDQKPTTVKWYKVSPDGQTTLVDGSSNNMSYTTPKESYSDNGTSYYAVMTIDNGDNSKSTITTNQAKLNVIKNVTPDVIINNAVINNSHDDHNDDNTVLNGVAAGDLLTYQVTINERNINSAMVSGVVGLRIPKTMEVTDVKVDGVSVSNVNFINDPDNSQGLIVIIYNLDFTTSHQKNLEIEATVGEINGLSFNSTVEFIGTDINDDDVISFVNEPSMLLNFANSTIFLTANDWQYKTINATGKARLIDRLAMTGNALEITDNRRDKKATQVYLTQTAPFKSGENTLSSEIRYFHSDGSYTTLDNTILVAQTNDGETVESIAWSQDEGPLLYLLDGNAIAGTYTTSLEWSLVESL